MFEGKTMPREDIQHKLNSQKKRTARKISDEGNAV